MKTEMVVRGYVGGREFDSETITEWMIWDTAEEATTAEREMYGTDESQEPEPVTLLLHGENGEVGGLEPWMVQYLLGDRHWHVGVDTAPTGLRPQGILDTIATAIANILNPEVSDG